MESFEKFQEIVLFWPEKIAQMSKAYWDVSKRSAPERLLSQMKTEIR